MDTEIIPTAFETGSGESMTLFGVVEKIDSFIKNCDDYTIDVGTDSQTNGGTRFVTAIVVCKRGKGGIFFYHTENRAKMPFMRDRIYEETRLSIQCASNLIDKFLEHDMLHNVTIHCDIGVGGKTKDLIREIVGYVTSSGFDCKIKPESIAACSIADKYSK